MLPDPNVTPTISVEAAAEALGISRSSAYRAVQSGQVPGLRFGRTWRVPVAPLRTLLGIDAGQVPASAADGSGGTGQPPALQAVRDPGLQTVRTREFTDTG